MPITHEMLLERRQAILNRISQLNSSLVQAKASLGEIDFLLKGEEGSVVVTAKRPAVAKKAEVATRKAEKKAKKRNGVARITRPSKLWDLLVEAGSNGLTSLEATKLMGKKGSASGSFSRWLRQGKVRHEGSKYYPVQHHA